jgi:hypothetical protein
MIVATLDVKGNVTLWDVDKFLQVRHWSSLSLFNIIRGDTLIDLNPEDMCTAKFTNKPHIQRETERQRDRERQNVRMKVRMKETKKTTKKNRNNANREKGSDQD